MTVRILGIFRQVINFIAISKVAQINLSTLAYRIVDTFSLDLDIFYVPSYVLHIKYTILIQMNPCGNRT